MKKHPGFTLIELLVVISVIGILMAISLVSYSGTQKQARDSTRRSDLGQYRNGLENYAANSNALYPNHQSGENADNMCNATELGPYLSSCPSDPLSSQEYRYFSNSATGSTKYMIWARLETSGYWYVCSDGRTGKSTSTPAASTCGL